VIDECFAIDQVAVAGHGRKPLRYDRILGADPPRVSRHENPPTWGADYA
jgi:hypothetical protein